MLFKIQWQKVETYETLVEIEHNHLDVDPQYDLSQVPACLLLELGDKVVETVASYEYRIQECQRIDEVEEVEEW